MRSRCLAGLVAVGMATTVASPVIAEPRAAARATHVEGRVDVRRGAKPRVDRATAGGPWARLEAGGALGEGDTVRTGPGSRVELTLADGSSIRLASNTSVTLERARFAAGGQRRVGLRLSVGRLWASVARRLGGSTFEVETRNAVAGARGTSFAVIAQADLSSVVKVYTATVGVKKSGAPSRGRRTEIGGPDRVDRRRWEEVIATAMHQVRVTRLGEIKPAEDFIDTGFDQAWAEWNQKRDAPR